MSIKQSRIEALRAGSKLCLNSSRNAQTATSINETSNQRRRRTTRDDCANALRARNAKMAYSTRCDAFRVKKCVPASWASLIVGKSQSSRGRTNREEFSAENSPLEAKKINAIQSSSGPYRPSRRNGDEDFCAWGRSSMSENIKGSRLCCFPYSSNLKICYGLIHY